jgi:hypothetical protein
MKKNVSLLLVACYFLPFCLFFAVTLFTSKMLAFCAALLFVSATTLTLFFAIKQLAFEKEPLPQVEKPQAKLQVKQVDLKRFLGTKEVSSPTMPFRATFFEGEKQKALQEKEAVQEKELLLLRQKVEFSRAAMDELKTEIQKKDEEIESLKFELRVLVRLDEKILSASVFDNKIPDAAKKT